MFGGPFMSIGVCLVGWVMVWNRPHYAFAATYALCLFILTLGLLAFYVGLPPLFQSLRGISLSDQLQVWLRFLAVISALPLAFLVSAFLIVALRKWMLARRAT
jgi:hypothetical protein